MNVPVAFKVSVELCEMRNSIVTYTQWPLNVEVIQWYPTNSYADSSNSISNFQIVMNGMLRSGIFNSVHLSQFDLCGI